MPIIRQEDLDGYSEFVFGPFVGELGWEIQRWAGYVRWFKQQNPEKKVYIVTRKGREDLYEGSVDGISSVIFNEDYTQALRPNMYRLDGLQQVYYDSIISDIRGWFPNAFLVRPPNSNRRDFFPLNEMDFEFTPRENNYKIITYILNEHTTRIPVVIAPRHRLDLGKTNRPRNWIVAYWHSLYETINNTEGYVVFIAGKNPSYVRPQNKSLSAFYVLEDLVQDVPDVSLIGLTIEAIKSSIVTIGQQSSIPVLSNLLGTPTIMWGDEKKRHRDIENPRNTQCTFFKEPSACYTRLPESIFSALTTYCEHLGEGGHDENL